MRSPLAMTPEMLPPSLPLFPLRDGLLLPGGQLPFSFHEPRYIHMAQDALASRDRLIGFVLPSFESPSPSLSNKKQPMHDVGCAGRITAFEETADERLIVRVTGYSRFKITKDIPTLRGYQRAEVSWNHYENDWQIDANPEIERESLIDSIKQFSQLASIEMDWQALEHTPNFTLVTFFAMSLPFTNNERQTILEADDVTARAILLEAMLHRAIEHHRLNEL